ncbi:hypothetical protein [Pseudomonas sp. S32]|uniref:hypothetical protein n=1 Tax=Pseudomonas sp. S32 TaxID=2767448 RepID=UPI00191451ED|nr:hypothetical protein [Pseudomonas sp. S32]MBK5003860.1 hypothetical protein [Pseudomonas sp. S32]
MLNLPAAWLVELNDQTELQAAPYGRALVLNEMAYADHRRQEISDEDLTEMLELADAGREWALLED